MAYRQEQTHDERFNDSYAEKGLQPSYKVRNIKKTQKPANDNSRALRSINTNAHYQNAPARRSAKILKFKNNKKGDPNKILETAARTKVMSLNIGIWSVGGFVWLNVQLFFFWTLSVIFFSSAVLVDFIFGVESDDVLNEDSGVVDTLFKFGKYLARSAAKLAGKVIQGLTGFDINVLNPQNMWFLSHFFIMIIGVTTLAIIYLVYTVNFVNCLSGRKAGAKKIAFLIAIVGYCTPFLNFAPWFIIWTIVVWRYPK